MPSSRGGLGKSVEVGLVWEVASSRGGLGKSVEVGLVWEVAGSGKVPGRFGEDLERSGAVCGVLRGS